MRAKALTSWLSCSFSVAPDHVEAVLIVDLEERSRAEVVDGQAAHQIASSKSPSRWTASATLEAAKTARKLFEQRQQVLVRRGDARRGAGEDLRLGARAVRLVRTLGKSIDDHARRHGEEQERDECDDVVGTSDLQRVERLHEVVVLETRRRTAPPRRPRVRRPTW